jgi:hypothetical protein
MTQRIRFCLPYILLVLSFGNAGAQELEPFAYAHNPSGANFFLAGYGQTWGDILFDPASPISDVNATWNNMVLGYGRTFSAFGRLANFAVLSPYVWGTASGLVDGEPGSTSRSGFADPRLRLGINLLGGPAMSLEEFAVATPRTTLGATVIVAPPLGEYIPEKIINLGSNRWSIKTEFGLSHPWRKWRFELAIGAWWFSDNDEFLGDGYRKQEHVTAYQAHIIYSFRHQLWVAIDATRYRGGETTVNGELTSTFQRNTRMGITASFPLTTKQSLKVTYSDGVATRIGGDFQQYLVAWQYTWF